MSSLGTLTRNYSSNTSVQLLVHSKPNRNFFHPPPLTYELFTETPAISIYYDPPPPPQHTKKRRKNYLNSKCRPLCFFIELYYTNFLFTPSRYVQVGLYFTAPELGNPCHQLRTGTTNNIAKPYSALCH